MDEPETMTRRPGRRPSTHNLRDLRDIPRACESCRKHKLRCSGDKPQCTHCAQKGQDCEYDQNGKAPASSSANSRKRPAPMSSYAQIKESRQRKRAAAAQTSCDFCRNDLRRKCDGLRPSCQSCIKRGVTCVYSGPASASTSNSATATSTPLVPQTTKPVSDNEADSDVVMGSRSGSPDIPLADMAKEDPKPRYPLGNGLGHAGSTRNPDGSNCTRPVACFFCIQVELPCTGDYPTCVNCIRRNRVCTYPDPSSYAHQFPRQSALHSRQLKEPGRGPGHSPGKSLSPGKSSRGSFDSTSRGVLDPLPRGTLEGPSSSSLRGILDPPTPTSRGGLDTSRSVPPTESGTPRSAVEPPRGTLDAPQPTLHTSRSLPGPLNQSRPAQTQATPTPPSMSVSPDPSVGTNNIHVVNATPNGHSHSRQPSGSEPDLARSELVRTPSVTDLARTSAHGTPSHPDLARTPSHPDLARTPSHDLARTPSHGDLRSRSASVHAHRTSTDMSRTLPDIESFRPQSQNQTQSPRPPLSRAPSSSSRTVTTPNDRDRDRRNSTSNSNAALSGVLGDVRAPQTPGGAPIGGVVVSPSGRTRDGASLMRERSSSQSQAPPKERDGFVNEGPASYRARHGEPPTGPAAYSPRSGARPNQTSSPRSPVIPTNQPPPGVDRDRQAPPPNQQPPHHPPTQPRRDSLIQARAGPGPSSSSVQVTTAGSPRRGSFNDRDLRPHSRAPVSLPPRPSQPSGRYGGEGHYETGRDLVLGRSHGHMRPEYGPPPWMGSSRPPPTGPRYDPGPRRDSMGERERWDRDERDRWDRDERDRWDRDRDERDRRDSLLDRRDPILVERDRRDPVLVERERRDSLLSERDRRDSLLSDRDRDRRNSVNGARPPPATWPPPQPAPPRSGGQPARNGPVEIRPEVLMPGPRQLGRTGSPVGNSATPLRSRAGSRSTSPRGAYLRTESGSVRSSPMDMDSS